MIQYLGVRSRSQDWVMIIQRWQGKGARPLLRCGARGHSSLSHTPAILQRWEDSRGTWARTGRSSGKWPTAAICLSISSPRQNRSLQGPLYGYWAELCSETSPHYKWVTAEVANITYKDENLEMDEGSSNGSWSPKPTQNWTPCTDGSVSTSLWSIFHNGHLYIVSSLDLL